MAKSKLDQMRDMVKNYDSKKNELKATIKKIEKHQNELMSAVADAFSEMDDDTAEEEINKAILYIRTRIETVKAAKKSSSSVKKSAKIDSESESTAADFQWNNQVQSEANSPQNLPEQNSQYEMNIDAPLRFD